MNTIYLEENRLYFVTDYFYIIFLVLRLITDAWPIIPAKETNIVVKVFQFY